MPSILIVEDESVIALDLKRTLASLGYEVSATVSTAEAALEAVTETPPDLVLMDIKLRGSVDGIAAAALIRKRLAVPIVFLTSYSDEETLQRAKDVQPYAYLLKPFNDRDLRTSVEIALERSRLERSVAEREGWLSTTLESIGDGVIAADAKGRINFVNPCAARLLAIDPAEAHGRLLREVLPPSLASLLDGSERKLVSGAHRSPAGETFTIEGRIAPVASRELGNLGSVVVLRDVGERVRLERELARATRLASLGTLTAGLAHEINNPLSYVTTNLSFSLDRLARRGRSRAETLPGAPSSTTEETEEIREALDDAMKGADRIQRIIADVGLLSRANDDAGTVVDVNEIMESALELTNSTLAEHASVRRALGDPPPVRANPTRLEQVFTNLLVNAAHAVGKGDADKNTIVVGTRRDEQGRAIIEVEDSGHGIAPDLLPRIFDPFFTTKAVGSGMGLGLFLCHAIVEAIGGSIVAESSAGGGAIFRVVLPGADAVAGAAKVRTSEIVESRCKKMRILVIEDDPGVAKAIDRILRDEHDVRVVTEPHRALEIIDRDPSFDIVLCDLMMPKVSGVELFDAVARANPALAEKFVFVTAASDATVAREFFERVPNRVISKPFDAELLRNAVRTLVGRSDPAVAT